MAGVPQRAGYIDRERDPETDLANFGVRAYDPDRGAFTSPEPLWPAMPGVSPYAYVGNDPLGYTDRSGLSGESPQSTPLEPASGGGGDVEQGLRWWQIERLLGNSGPDDGRLGQRKPKRKRDRVVMGPPSPPKGDRGAKIVPPPIIVEAPPPIASKGSGGSGAGEAFAATMMINGALLADDVTGIGVADDVLIPVVTAVGSIVVAYLWISYAFSEDDESGEADGSQGKTVDDVLEDATPIGKSSTKKYQKGGGMEEALDDFWSIVKPNSVVDKGNDVLVGELPGSGYAVVRPASTEGSPTLELQSEKGRPKIKIRYSKKQ